MFTTTNKQEVLIGKSLARTASVQIKDATAAAYIADGEVLILDEQGTPVAAPTFATAPKIMLVQRSGATAATSNLIFSSWIDGRFVNAFKGTDGTASSEQVTVLGYNGTSGSIDVSAATEFFVKLQYKHDTKMWSEQQNIKMYQYYATTPTQAALCSAIAKAVNEDEGRMVSTLMYNSANAAGVAAVGGAADTAAGSIGSNIITVTDGGGPTVAIAAGSYFRAGLLTTSPIYLVTASTVTGGVSGTLTLDSPLQATFSLAGNACEFLTAAAADAGDSGLKFTGLPLVFALDQFPYMKTRFNVTLEGFGTTVAPTTTAAVRGIGTGELVAEHEYEAKGARGALNKNVWPLPSTYNQIDADWATPAIYDTIFISHNNGKQVDTITGQRISPQEIYLYVVEGAGQTTEILTALNTWMASVPGAFPNITT